MPGDRDDFFDECFTDPALHKMLQVGGKPVSQVSAEDFKKVVCATCRNIECINSPYSGMSQWEARVLTQMERLFENAQFSDLSLPAHAQIHEMDFPDLLAKAQRVVYATRTGEWLDTNEEIPVVHQGSKSATAVSDAVKALRGGAEPKSRDPVPEKIEDPKAPPGVEVHRIPDPEEEEPEQEPTPTPEPPLEPEPERQVVTSGTKKIVQRPQQQHRQQGGTMIGGDAPPIHEEKRQQEIDPWAPPKERKVNVGGTVKMGGNNDE